MYIINYFDKKKIKIKEKKQLLTTDTLVLRSMKNTAKCDKSCELQISVNHRIFERNTHS